MGLAEKIRVIRKAERLTQKDFCEVVGISESSFRKYEAGFIKVGAPALLKITNHPRFKKYALWLVTDDFAVMPAQISPE